ncbi:CaiB/BaiF CoA transferase family protein [Roseovarius amoyensis]|uniref:CaiB/BaiF CoA transferase family protein n=1 Tax=Roseovarius amoyensis TaxID=2211448 RepID=UPI000DBE97EF|nr:CoA transferase [Roseovarius amoyensis]
MTGSKPFALPVDLPLDGVVVVEICHSMSGPFAGSILAQLGARLIKVENREHGDHARGWGPPFWHGSAAAFQAMNRDKESVTVNLRDPNERAGLRQFILEHADVVVQNLRPGSLAEGDFSGSDFRVEKPALIYCNLGAFGARGPLSSAPGYDPLMQAFGGIMSVTGEAEGGPVRVGPAIIDLGTGMWSALGIIAALFRRKQTGTGCIVDTSLFETALSWMSVQIAGYLASGDIRKPMGSAIPEIVPHQAFRAKDGYIMIAAGNDKLFASFCKALGAEDLATEAAYAMNEGRVRNRDILIPLLEKLVNSWGREDLSEALNNAGVPNSPIQSIDEVVAHPQTVALDIIQECPDIDLRLVGLPISFDGIRPSFRKRAPALGEHSHCIANSAKPEVEAEPQTARDTKTLGPNAQ